MAYEISSLMKGLERAASSIRSVEHDLPVVLKNVNSGVSKLDEVFSKMRVSEAENGIIKVGEHFPGELRQLIREGDLSNLMKALKSAEKISAEEMEAFSKLTGNTPEKAIRNILNDAEKLNSQHPHLNITINEIENLTNQQKGTLEKIGNNIKRIFGKAGKLTLTIGTLYVGTNCIIRALKERKGCFMVTTIDGKSTSCKVQNYSCIGISDEYHTSSVTNCDHKYSLYNVTLTLMYIATLPDTDKNKLAVAQAADIDVINLCEKLDRVIDTKYNAVAKAIHKMNPRPQPHNICTLTLKNVENGIVPPCRMCDSSANPISTEYIDRDQIADNIFFRCEVNPSLTQTLADIAISGGKKVLDGVKNTLIETVKPLAMVIIVIIAIASLIIGLLKFGPKMMSNISNDTPKYARL